MSRASILAKLKASAHWPGSSAFVLTAVAGLSKLWIGVYLDLFNKLNVVNKSVLYKHVESRKPLITVANHSSCMDDPLMWASLKWDIIAVRPYLMRWTLAADEICFTNFLTKKFFTLGRCVSVIRGHGVYQKGVDDCLEVLNNNGWVHIFPEGKVNLNKAHMRLKWGVARLIAEAKVLPTVLPIWHTGMDDVLPNKKPYIPRFGKTVTMVVGDPICLENILNNLKAKKCSSREIRIAVTEVIQEALSKVKQKSELIHNKLQLVDDAGNSSS